MENQKYAWREIERVDEPQRGPTSRVLDFLGTRQPYDEATAQAQASRCVECPNANCVTACPLDVPIPQIMALAAAGQFQAATDLLFTTQSLPELFAHVCVEGRLCEGSCVVSARAEPVPIGAISRFLIDYGWKHGVKEPRPAPCNGRRVLVIGSGLCCLVAADALSLMGFGVVVMDSMAEPGGRFMNRLPGFRVDKPMIQYRIQSLKNRGVRFQMGIKWEEHLTLEELRRGYDAIFIGLGRTDPAPLGIPGENFKGVHQAYPFVLQKTADANLSSPNIEAKGKRVLILGGGETAIDALRVALRCEAREAACVCRRDEANLAANPRFYHEALEEGGRFHFLSQAVAILGDKDGFVTGVRCLRTKLLGADATGRGIPCILPNTEFDLPADLVLAAYGFLPPVLPPAGNFHQLARNKRGCLVVDANQMTNLPGIYAGGAIVRGPAPLTEIIRDARQAAICIDRYLCK